MIIWLFLSLRRNIFLFIRWVLVAISAVTLILYGLLLLILYIMLSRKIGNLLSHWLYLFCSLFSLAIIQFREQKSSTQSFNNPRFVKHNRVPCSGSGSLFQNCFILLLLLVKWWKNTVRIHLQNINSDEAVVSSGKIFHGKLLPTLAPKQAPLGLVGQTDFELAKEEALTV